MTAKKKPAPAVKKPVTATQPTTTATPEAPKKERKKTVRKAPLDRALQRARLLDKNASALLRLVTTWRSEVTTDDQQSTNDDVAVELRQICKLAPSVLLNLDMLGKSEFAPKEGSVGGSKAALAAGARVAIKDKHFNAGLYRANDFEVVLDAGKQVRIRPAGDLRAPQIDVSRTWLVVLDSTDVDDPADLDADGDEDDADPVDEDAAGQ
jgi:hypothetical protein